ncbi:kelch repeat and BTB domain-containing protein 3-like [Physella acuta]|uniref:kelch repeat and BTB domain-containing protein 3-like n=1 Tax=Physella acuta TaxID=109671 RepID=UPI0027DD9799|nr:kelch repeat and BTB domain-containing protein 3-like [Physella acuta]
MNRQTFCDQIVKGLENVWNENILFDFAVKVQDETIQCHRLILAACSDFFKALFRSGMKEVTENCVVLKDVSCEVFRLIINTIYTGTNLITVDNFNEVWRAAHMLQINFLVTFCEEFAIKTCSLDTWENYYLHAKLLGSVKVLDKIHTFMLKNFEQIQQSTTYLQMSFQEVQELIENEDLFVSNEDVVLEAVIRWVEYVDEMPPREHLSGKKIMTNSNKDLGNETDFHNKNEENTFKAKNDNNINHDNWLQTARQAVTEVRANQSMDSVEIVKHSRKDKLIELLIQVKICLGSVWLIQVTMCSQNYSMVGIECRLIVTP